jgi:hypothetical protein
VEIELKSIMVSQGRSPVRASQAFGLSLRHARCQFLMAGAACDCRESY